MKGQDEEDPQINHDLPWNRHKRRRLLTSKGVIVHLFAVEKAKEWRRNPINGIEVITLDITEGRNQDLHNPGTWSFLWKLASLGKCLAIIGGPPCRTVSRLRQKQPGPRPLRGRFHDRYGLPGLTDREKNLADSDAALLLKQVGLFIRSEECCERHRVRTAFLLESPQDPLTYVPQAREEESPSFWAWPELMQLRVLWALTTETDHVPHKPGGHERLGRSTQHQALRGPTKGHQGPCRPHGRYGHRD